MIDLLLLQNIMNMLEGFIKHINIEKHKIYIKLVVSF